MYERVKPRKVLIGNVQSNMKLVFRFESEFMIQSFLVASLVIYR